MIRLMVVGAAGFGREVLDVVDAMVGSESEPGLKLVGVLDDDPSPANLTRLQRRGVDYCGTVAAWLAGNDDAQFIIGIGHPTVRRHLAERLEGRGRHSPVLVHPAATFGFGVKCDPGVVVCAGVQVSNEVQLGAHSHLNPNVAIGHDTVLEKYVSINPGATVSGACHLEQESLIGAGAVVLQQRRVGAGSVVGAAACVTRHVAPGTTVVGVPAR